MVQLGEAIEVYEGDCRTIMRALAACSIDAIVCDPPYNLGFMGKEWDKGGVAFASATWGEALRVLKPGGHLLAFGGTRTYHRMASAIEDAGFEIRDQLQWLYAQGFPKSLDVAQQLDKERHEREAWEGWGTALKPAHEPLCLARKPLSEATVAKNVLKWGTGALNIDACRITTNDSLGGGAEKHCHFENKSGWDRPWMHDEEAQTRQAARIRANVARAEALGRWPANVLLDEEAAALLDAQSGEGETRRIEKPCPAPRIRGDGWGTMQSQRGPRGYTDKGGASRFFFCPKASRSEREAGLEHKEPERSGYRSHEPEAGYGGNGLCARSHDSVPARNHHPTVKPVALMRWLVRLVTPSGALVLDPFMGSGTTGIAALRERVRFVGIELQADYYALACARITAALATGQQSLIDYQFG